MSAQRRVAILIGLIGLTWGLRASAKAVISEVQWMGTDLSTADEWVEISCFITSEQHPSMGAATEECPIGNWTLTSLNSKGEEAVIARFATGAVIGSGQYVIVANAVASASRLEAAPWIVTSDISLPNTKLLLRLRSATGALTDAVDDGVGAPFGGLSKVKAGSGSGLGSGRLIWASMERIDLSGSGQLKTNWRSAKTFRGFDDGAPLFGTPGFPNDSGHSIDLSPPLEATDLEAWTASGSLFVLWSPSRSLDLHSQILTAGSGSIILGATASGWALGGCTDASGSVLLPECFSGSLISVRSEDLLHNANYGSTTRVQPYRKSMNNEQNSSSIYACPPFDARLVIQSGKTVSEGKLTINIQATATGITLSKLQCHIDFSDGFRVDRCNPGSHTFTEPGIHTITLTARDQCDNTVKRWIDIEVLRKEIKETDKAEEPEDFCKASGSGTSAPIISEVFPNPLEDEEAGEWIELQNRSLQPLPLCGWMLADTTALKKPYALSGSDMLPGEFRVIPRAQSRIALNNTDESIVVLQKTQSGYVQRQEVSYEKAPEDRSLSLDAYDVYRWTPTRTPGSGNLLPETEYAIRMEPGSSILQSGSGVRIRLAAISDLAEEYVEPLSKPYFVSLNSGSFMSSSESLIIDEDTSVRAYALLGGVRTPIVEERYEVRRKTYLSAVRISEISPRSGVCIPGLSEPAAADSSVSCPEWIELYNPYAHAISLSGWSIDDESDVGSKPYVLPFGLQMGSGSYAILSASQLKISLNDDGDTVMLIDPSGTVRDSIQYPKMKKGRTYARGPGWCLAFPTAMSSNACEVHLSSSALSSAKSQMSSSSRISLETQNVFPFSAAFSESQTSRHAPLVGEILSANTYASPADDMAFLALLASLGVGAVIFVRPKP